MIISEHSALSTIGADSEIGTLPISIRSYVQGHDRTAPKKLEVNYASIDSTEPEVDHKSQAPNTALVNHVRAVSRSILNHWTTGPRSPFPILILLVVWTLDDHSAPTGRPGRGLT